MDFILYIVWVYDDDGHDDDHDDEDDDDDRDDDQHTSFNEIIVHR